MTATLRIAALEPYAALSHRLFLEGLQAHSRHRIEGFTLPPRAWKWRMRTAALHYAARLRGREPFDLLFASDYVNVAELLALLPPHQAGVPVVSVFHENQLTYPLQPGEARDHHFALTHLYSALASRRTIFNSHYHRDSFLVALAALLAHVPDVDTRPALETVRRTSAVLPLGTDLGPGRPRVPERGEAPVLLWNHRFEYDKDPGRLLETLEELLRLGVDFRVRLLGERFRSVPPERELLARRLGARLLEDGFVSDRSEYVQRLERSHVVLSTARHEFFGLGTLEALRTGLWPVLPRALAYPELVPEGSPAASFYEPGGAVPALVRALEGVARGHELEARHALVASTDAFAWPVLAPRWDAVFEEAVESTPGGTSRVPEARGG